MRPIWKGAVSFGLVNIPIKMFAATEDRKISFRQLHVLCENPIRYQKWCPHCNRAVERQDIIRGYEFARGKFVLVSQADLEQIPVRTARTIDILDFIAMEEVDPIYFNRSYFLGPDKGGEKAYFLLEKALSTKGRVAIAKVTLRSKENLALLRPYRGVVIMETLYYPEEIRPATDLETGTFHELDEREIELALQLIDNLTVSFDPERYRDNYRESLMDLIEARIQGKEISQPEVPEDEGIIDLVDALKASLEASEQESREKELERT